MMREARAGDEAAILAFLQPHLKTSMFLPAIFWRMVSLSANTGTARNTGSSKKAKKSKAS